MVSFPFLSSFTFTGFFPFQVTSTWQAWPKACTATSQSLWPPGMAFRAVWRQWTWMDGCLTSSTMLSIGVDRSSVAVKVQPFFLLSYSLVASPEPLCCLCRCLLPWFTSSLSFPFVIRRRIIVSVLLSLLSMLRHVPQAPGMCVGRCLPRITSLLIEDRSWRWHQAPPELYLCF